MSEVNHFKNRCRVCLTVPTNAQLLLLSANLEEKLDFIHGSLKNDKCHQVSKYICSKCEPELEAVHTFLIKLKSSNFRIEHGVARDEEHVIYPVVKTEKAESENENCELENDYGGSATELIHQVKNEEVPKLDVAPIDSNCNQKKRKQKPRKKSKTKICDICDKSFCNRSNLVRHLQSHQGKLFVCGYENCNLPFHQKSTLKIHMVVHTGEKPFGCTVCNKKFTQQKSLALHLKIHKNERSYECDRCKKRFIQKPNFQRHLKGNCKADRTTKFQCLHCHNYFATKQSLLRHKKLHEVKSMLENKSFWKI